MTWRSPAVSRAARPKPAADAIRAAGRRAVVLQADLAEPAACRSLVDAAAEALGGLSAVVLAASRFDRLAFDALDAAAWDRAMAVDLDASFHCAQAAIPHLRRAGGGHIVLFSDWVAASGRPRYRGYLPYYVAKRSVVALGEALASGAAADGIRVHVIAPGPIVPAAGQHAEGRGGGARRDPARPLGRRGRSGAAGRRRSSGRPSSPGRRSGSTAAVTWVTQKTWPSQRSVARLILLAARAATPWAVSDPL